MLVQSSSYTAMACKREMIIRLAGRQIHTDDTRASPSALLSTVPFCTRQYRRRRSTFVYGRSRTSVFKVFRPKQIIVRDPERLRITAPPPPYEPIRTCLSVYFKKRFLIHRSCRLAYCLVTCFMSVIAASRALRPSSVSRLSIGSSKYRWNCFTPMHCNTPFVKFKLKKTQLGYVGTSLVTMSFVY